MCTAAVLSLSPEPVLNVLLGKLFDTFSVMPGRARLTVAVLVVGTETAAVQRDRTGVHFQFRVALITETILAAGACKPALGVNRLTTLALVLLLLFGRMHGADKLDRTAGFSCTPIWCNAGNKGATGRAGGGGVCAVRVGTLALARQGFLALRTLEPHVALRDVVVIVTVAVILATERKHLRGVVRAARGMEPAAGAANDTLPATFFGLAQLPRRVGHGAAIK